MTTNESKNTHRRKWLVLAALPLLAATTAIWRSSCEPGHRSLRQQPTWRTPKLAGTLDDARVLNVHIVPHTHDDVGWLKTVDQYYYGLNETIQQAHVQSILTTVVQALLANSNRTFTYVETKFFSMWWNEQRDEVKQNVRELVSNHQLAFANGGWCMHDEGATHFIGMIDQTTLGHDFLLQELNVIPTIGWQLDPFGHSATQASLMSREMGFNALYFGRIDYQDLKKRHDEQECEGVWSSSPEKIDDGAIFWGLTGEYQGQYGPPVGFCFDIHCEDEAIVDMDEEKMLDKVVTWAKSLQVQASRTKGNHIMQTMGEDFQYEQAAVNFANYDLLISKFLEYQEKNQINISSIFGPRFDRVNVFYSNPAHYTEMKFGSNTIWTIKTDDFMPYAIREHGFLTGYFTSRTSFKRLERVGSSFLQAARQVESMHRGESDVGTEDCKCMQPLYALDDALGVSQHHDAVSGTAKQHVANDYSTRIQAGIDQAASYVIKKIKKILFEEADLDFYLNDMMFCQLLNETKCDVTETASKAGDKAIYVVVYNPLASMQQVVISIPVHSPGLNKKLMVSRLDHARLLRSTMVASPKEGGKVNFQFDTGPLPPTGAVVYRLVWSEEFENEASRLSHQTVKEETTTLVNGVLTVDFDTATGGIQKVTTADGISLDLSQEWGYYTSYDSHFNEQGYYQNSGAYIFRPSEPNAKISAIQPKSAIFRQSELVAEVAIEFEQSWIQQTIRLFENMNYIEVEYTVGPVPVQDGRGKEVVVKYASEIKNDGVFFTDSNGREFQKRIRSFRPTWDLNETEPVAGNYYPVNAAMYIQDHVASMAIATDRSVGGSSIVDGAMEVMVQRRILRDDSLGLFEALNETTDGMTPYPPYGDATREGDGVVLKGKHRIMIGGAGEGAKLARLQMDNMFASPLIFAASEPFSTTVPFQNHSFALLEEALPPNVMLITYKLLPGAPSITFLIRLGHQFGMGEAEHLSEPAMICLGQVVSPHTIVSIREKTLSGNQDYEDWTQRRMDWTGGHVETRHPVMCVGGSCLVELKPMEIRTFVVQVNRKTGESSMLE